MVMNPCCLTSSQLSILNLHYLPKSYRKYKWWKQKRAEEEKGGVKSEKRILVEEERDLFKEIVKLPPYVSSKVNMSLSSGLVEFINIRFIWTILYYSRLQWTKVGYY